MKRKIEGGILRAKVYPLLVEAIEAGVAYGLNRAHKHTDTPTREQIAEAIEQAVMNEMCERFQFDGDGD